VSARRGLSGRRGSITTRLILLLTLALAAIIALLLALDYRLSRDEILEGVRDEARSTVRGAITDLDNWLRGIESSTLFLARLLEQGTPDRAGLDTLLRTFLETHEDIFGATIALNPEMGGSARGFAPYYHPHRPDISGEQLPGAGLVQGCGERRTCAVGRALLRRGRW